MALSNMGNVVCFEAIICGNNILYVMYNLNKLLQKSGITEGNLCYIYNVQAFLKRKNR